MKELSGNTASNHGDDCMLDIVVISTRHLFNMQNATRKVPHSSMFVMAFEACIEFSTKELLAPRKDVVKKEFMACMENFGEKESGGIHKSPISKKQKVDATKLQRFRQFLIARQVPRISLLIDFVNALECELASTRWVGLGVAKLLLSCLCDGGSAL